LRRWLACTARLIARSPASLTLLLSRLLWRLRLWWHILRLRWYQLRLRLQQLWLGRQHLRLRHCWPLLPGQRLCKRRRSRLVHLRLCVLHGRLVSLRLRDGRQLVLGSLRGYVDRLLAVIPPFVFLFAFCRQLGLWLEGDHCLHGVVVFRARIVGGFLLFLTRHNIQRHGK
jgi:hypothetical protein